MKQPDVQSPARGVSHIVYHCETDGNMSPADILRLRKRYFTVR